MGKSPANPFAEEACGTVHERPYLERLKEHRETIEQECEECGKTYERRVSVNAHAGKMCVNCARDAGLVEDDEERVIAVFSDKKAD
jgi:hypothetical protein